MEKDVLNEIVHRNLIADVVTLLFVRTDQKDWPAVRACFTDQVLFDMSSMGGGKPALVPADEIVSTWANGLKPLQAIHHQVGNFLIEIKGDEATALCYGIASHYLPNPTNANIRVFVGDYELHLVWQQSRWRIDGFRFNLKYIDGNRNLEASASPGENLSKA